jgi:hypothetical protein
VAGTLLLAEPNSGEPKQKEFTERQRQWWAFTPVANPKPPAVKTPAWVGNQIDAFVLAKLEEKGLRPNPPADKATLLRRAHLTVTGLPPTPEETQAFLADSSPNAWAKVVDRLLESKHYGERWGRHWLDLARYADSEGFKSDETRPNVWRYRDYVIRALNADKPYNRFVQEQIAGDEMFPGDIDALVATGFNRHFPDESNAANIMQRRQELLNDITDVVGSTMMAMTYGCARCHDHKFDPILHKDYYRLQAFFANTRIEDDAQLANSARQAEHKAKLAVWEAKTAHIRTQIDALIQPRYKARYEERLSRFPEEIQAVINMPADKRNPYEWQMYQKAKAQVTFSEEEIAGLLRGAEKAKYAELKKQLAAFDNIKPKALPVAQAMIDESRNAPPTHVLSVGNHEAKMYQVEPGFLSILDAAPAKVEAGENTTGRRTALARWLTRADNPLTARVMVNRIWHYHFGRGIVGSPSDFGVMGERPANKELLDWLAHTFVHTDNWSMKAMHRRILMSNAFRRSSAHSAEAAEIDPDNKHLWRFNRRRLEGEIIRDSMLSVAGVLNGKMFGPGVFPPLPPGMTTRGGWKKDENADESRRRSVYTFVRRNTRYPMFEAFDMPDTHEPCARRNLTTSSTQALELLNSEQVVEWSRSLAKRVANDSGMSREAQVERAYRLAFQRPPSAEESRLAASFLDRQAVIAGDPQAAFADLCHMLLNSNEFVFIN